MKNGPENPTASQLWGNREPGEEHRPAFTIDNPRPEDAELYANVSRIPLVKVEAVDDKEE